jgi:hypothetical protein
LFKIADAIFVDCELSEKVAIQVVSAFTLLEKSTFLSLSSIAIGTTGRKVRSDH